MGRSQKMEPMMSGNRTLKIAVNLSLVGVLLGAHEYGKHKHTNNEKVWVNSRGPLSIGAPRPMAGVPMMACLGSGVIAALAEKLFPTQAHVLKLGSQIHNLTALPMSILLVFRFEGSHSRWATARNELENMNANVLALAMASISTQEVKKTASEDLFPALAKHEARMVAVLDAFCWYADNLLMCGRNPHPANMPVHWSSVDLLESPD